MKTIATTTAILVTSGLFADTARAGHHIDELAYTLRNQAVAVTREVYTGFRGTPQFEHLYSDVYEMYKLADHIHDVAHVRGSIPHIRRDMEEMDELFHHVEDLVADISRNSRSSHRSRFGHHGHHGHYGHHGVSSYHLRRLCRLLEEMEDTMHHLLEDVSVGAVPVPAVPTPPTRVVPVPSQVGPVFPQSTRRGRVIDIRTGNGRFGFRLNLR